MSFLIKSLFRLMVVTFIFAMLTPVTTWAVPFCEKHPNHQKCNGGGGGGGGGGEPGTFRVDVFFEPAPVVVGARLPATVFAGFADNVVGNSDFDEGHFRAGLGEATMMLDLTKLDTMSQLPDCKTTFVGVNGLFAISTARREENGQLTSAFAGFWNFTASDGVSYSVNFDNGLLDQLGKWLPGPQSGNILRGDQINLAVTKGPTKKGPCNGIIMQNWKIDVLNEAPVT